MRSQLPRFASNALALSEHGNSSLGTLPTEIRATRAGAL